MNTKPCDLLLLHPQLPCRIRPVDPVQQTPPQHRRNHVPQIRTHLRSCIRIHVFRDKTCLPQLNKIRGKPRNDQRLEPAVIAELGHVFQRHEVQDRFGIHLLHRHFIVPNGSIMFKLPPVDSDISLTKITPVGTVDINAVRGVLYLLNQIGKFQAYEFEDGDPVDIPPAFLKDLSTVLKKFGLEKVIALDVCGGPASRTFPKSLEYTLGNVATVTVQVKSKFESHRLTGVSFLTQDGKVWPEATDGYEENTHGTHTVFYEKSIGSRLPAQVDDFDINIDSSKLRGLLIANGILQ